MIPLRKNYFPPPLTEIDQNLFQAGSFYFWLRYQSTPSPKSSEFLGYALYADPYHRGLKKISFLLGSDCSHFVHRFYQVLGADYPYMKTRHFLQLAKGQLKEDNDFNSCQKQIIKRSFKYLGKLNSQQISQKVLLRESSPPLTNEIQFPFKIGDLLVIKKSVSQWGEHGHMAIVHQTQPEITLLHSKGPKDGIKIETIDMKVFDGSDVFRWNTDLPRNHPSFKNALQQNFPEFPENCAR